MEKKTNKVKKTVKAKDIRSAKKVVGALQEYNQAEIRKHLLYLLQDGAIWGKLADGTYVAKGECGCLLKIRHQDSETTVLSLQHKSWGAWGCLLHENAKGNRSRSNAKTRRRQKSTGKSVRPLSKPNSKVSRRAGTVKVGNKHYTKEQLGSY